LRDDAIRSMTDYFQGEKYSRHTLKVLAAAEKIADAEKIPAGFLRESAVLGCIFHDIGIPEAQKKHGSIDGPYQEKEGPSVARRLMADLAVRADILERVCYLVGFHHTKDRVDGLDFQLLWEADFIVNVEEKNLRFTREDIGAAIRANTATEMGARLAREAAERIGLL